MLINSLLVHLMQSKRPMNPKYLNYGQTVRAVDDIVGRLRARNKQLQFDLNDVTKEVPST